MLTVVAACDATKRRARSDLLTHLDQNLAALGQHALQVAGVVQDDHVAQLAHGVGEAHFAPRRCTGDAAGGGTNLHGRQLAIAVGAEFTCHAAGGGPAPRLARLLQRAGVRAGDQAATAGARGRGAAARATVERHRDQHADIEIIGVLAGVGGLNALRAGTEIATDLGVGIAGAQLIAIRAAGGRPLARGGHQDALTDLEVTNLDARIEAREAQQGNVGIASDLPQGIALLDGDPLAGRRAGVAAGRAAAQPQAETDQRQPAQREAGMLQKWTVHVRFGLRSCREVRGIQAVFSVHQCHSLHVTVGHPCPSRPD